MHNKLPQFKSRLYSFTGKLKAAFVSPLRDSITARKMIFALLLSSEAQKKAAVSPADGGAGGGGNLCKTFALSIKQHFPNIFLGDGRSRATMFAAFFLFTGQIFAQQQIITTATDYITHSQFQRAEQYLDSILKQNPKAVNALMMKGNVLLNQAWEGGAKSHFNTEKAESIFDSSMIDETYFTPIIPLDTSIKIDHYWKKCLELDPTRTDIKKGLCSLYSLSLRTNELQRQLIQMQSIITETEDNAYLYAEYARNLKNRGRFDDAMQVYSLIANMFPNLSGIRCDMAYEYFYAGKMPEALNYVDSALSKKEVDQTTFINAAALYSELGYYNEAYKTFKRYSEKDTLIEADFYKGLMMFANMDSGFYNQLQRFIDQANEQSYYDEIQLARKLLPYGRVPFTLDDLRAFATNEKIARYYRVLILSRGVRQFKNDCEPLFFQGSLSCLLKNYAAATLQLDPEINLVSNDCHLETTEKQLWPLYLGFTFYKKDEGKNALVYFSAVSTSKNNFIQQAGKYFAAKIDWEAGKKEEAKKLFEEVAMAKEPTKYSWLAKGYAGR